MLFDNLKREKVCKWEVYLCFFFAPLIEVLLYSITPANPEEEERNTDLAGFQRRKVLSDKMREPWRIEKEEKKGGQLLSFTLAIRAWSFWKIISSETSWPVVKEKQGRGYCISHSVYTVSFNPLILCNACNAQSAQANYHFSSFSVIRISQAAQHPITVSAVSVFPAFLIEPVPYIPCHSSQCSQSNQHTIVKKKRPP
jgi:hypothetical protein